MMMRDASDEDVVVFDEDGQTRSLKGTILKEDENFITITRRDGTFKIAMKTVKKVIYKTRNGGAL